MELLFLLMAIRLSLNMMIFDIDIDDGTRVVVAPDGFDVVSMLRVGDRVFVAGTFVNNELHAYGVRKITIEDAI